MPRNFSKKVPNKLTKPAKAAPKNANKIKKATEATQPKKRKSPKKSSSVEQIIEDTFSAANTIKVLEDRNRHLQDMLEHTTTPDRPYGHGKSTDYLIFGRTREQYSELIKIAAHLKATNKNPTEAIEKIENYPLKLRDKFILLLQITSDN